MIFKCLVLRVNENCIPKIWFNGSGTYPSVLAAGVVPFEHPQSRHVGGGGGSHPGVDAGAVDDLSRPVVATHQPRQAVRVRQHKHISHFISPGVLEIRQHLD